MMVGRVWRRVVTAGAAVVVAVGLPVGGWAQVDPEEHRLLKQKLEEITEERDSLQNDNVGYLALP